jgi:hypothetical protein
MQVKVLLQITADDGAPGGIEEIISLEKRTDGAEDLGLSLGEGKRLIAAAQQRIVEAQAKAWVDGRRCCEHCLRRRKIKGSYPILFHTLYGDVRLASPRLHRCPCRGGDGAATASPLAELIPHHIAPERLYLETRWASLVPYVAAAELLADVLPIATGANATTVRQHVLRVAERAEAELPTPCPASMDSALYLGRKVVGERAAMPSNSHTFDFIQADLVGSAIIKLSNGLQN